MDEYNVFLEKQLERINYWLSYAEAKNGALLVINIAILAVMANFFETIPEICAVVMIILIISSVYCLYSFFPDLSNSYKEKEVTCNSSTLNLLFWGDINKIKSSEDYLKLLKERYYTNLRDDDVYNLIAKDFAEEIMINSHITVKKYFLFRRALYVDIVALLGCILLIVMA